MPVSPLHPLAVGPKLARSGRTLAGAQVLKETLSIIFPGLPLVKAAPLVPLSALPGVVLYLLRWQLALGRVGRFFTAVVWGLLLFQELDSPTRGQIRPLDWSYFLGLGIILLALGELG